MSRGWNTQISCNFSRLIWRIHECILLNLAPYNEKIAGCWGFKGSVPPPLLISSVTYLVFIISIEQLEINDQTLDWILSVFCERVKRFWRNSRIWAKSRGSLPYSKFNDEKLVRCSNRGGNWDIYSNRCSGINALWHWCMLFLRSNKAMTGQSNANINWFEELVMKHKKYLFPFLSVILSRLTSWM